MCNLLLNKKINNDKIVLSYIREVIHMKKVSLLTVILSLVLILISILFNKTFAENQPIESYEESLEYQYIEQQ